LADRLCLSLVAIEEIFGFLRREQLCEVKGMAMGSHRIAVSAHGKTRATELLSLNRYAGPAPVSLADYTARVNAQSVQLLAIQPSDLKRAFQQLVLPEATLTKLGAAVVSGTSIFMYGPSGTGKTTIGSCIPAIYNDTVLVPYAVEVDNQIITVFDPGVHHLVEYTTVDGDDKRWVRCERPRVMAGGELSSEMLELQFNAATRFCTAPLQMKANNGVLLIDDFGRQRMRPDELLNRWMTPLDRRMDFLSLPGGKKFEIPFDLFVVFSTNLNPNDLADEAFLRRVPNKIKIGHATPEQFIEIFRILCERRRLPYNVGLPEQLVDYITDEIKQPLSQCYVRDLLDQVVWAARYQGVEPRLTPEALEQACQSYFLNDAAP
jgi:predicted ATPase with chaperone activity